jgi:hypothetical protein
MVRPILAALCAPGMFYIMPEYSTAPLTSRARTVQEVAGRAGDNLARGDRVADDAVAAVLDRDLAGELDLAQDVSLCDDLIGRHAGTGITGTPGYSRPGISSRPVASVSTRQNVPVRCEASMSASRVAVT